MNQDNYDKAAMLAYLDAMVDFAQDAKEGGIENRNLLRELGADLDRQAVDLMDVTRQGNGHQRWLQEINEAIYELRREVDKTKSRLGVGRVALFALATLQTIGWLWLAAEKYGWMT